MDDKEPKVIECPFCEGEGEIDEQQIESINEPAHIHHWHKEKIPCKLSESGFDASQDILTCCHCHTEREVKT